MKTSIENLTRFIDDFGLKQPDNTIRFFAVLEYNVNGETKREESEVHIITSDHLASVYLLFEKVLNEHLPDLFDARKNVMAYKHRQYLSIEYPNGILFIHPKIASI